MQEPNMEQTRSNSGNIIFFLLTVQRNSPPCFPSLFVVYFCYIFALSRRTCAVAISQETS